MAKKTTESLLSKIKGNTASEAKPVKGEAALKAVASLSKPPEPGGKPAAFWLDPQDREILHEFAVMLFAQGIKPSDSLIARTALRFLPRDHRFLEVAQSLIARDRRRVQNRKPKENAA